MFIIITFIATNMDEPQTTIVYQKINDDYSYQIIGDLKLIIRTKDEYINATNLCKQSGIKGKLYSEWKRNKDSKRTITALSKLLNIPEDELVHSVSGGHIIEIRGTYVHPVLLTRIGIWISGDFSCKCSIWVNEWKNTGNNRDKYAVAIGNLEGTYNNNQEKQIRDVLATETGGETEVKCKNGYIDILTDCEVIEVKNAKKWMYALGQILAYKIDYPEKNMRIHLFNATEEYINNATETCELHGVSVTWEDY
jgi:hypothetical protein